MFKLLADFLINFKSLRVENLLQARLLIVLSSFELLMAYP